MTLLAARSRAMALALGGILCASPVLADVPAKKPRAKPARAAEARAAVSAESAARPDAELYKEAQRAHATLNATKARLAQRPEWEKVVLRYRRVVARYPQSGYSDNALLQVGDLYRAMAARFSRRAYGDDAVAAYRSLVAEYPSSRLGEKALFAIAEIARDRGDRSALQAAVKDYLAHYPDAARAKDAKALLARKGRPVEEAALPKAPKPGLARVFNLRLWSGASSTRVVIDVERQVPIRHDRIADPDRLWIDLDGTRLHPNLLDRSFPVGDGLLEKVRIAQNKEEVVRVVLDFKDVRDHTIFYLENPLRLVVDVRGTQPPRTASAARPPEPVEPPDLPPASPEPETLPEPRRSAWTRHVPSSPAASPAPAGAPIAFPSPTPSPTPRPVRAADARPPAVAPAPVSTLPPAVNRAGSYSLARQLGLGARTIVIDAGHGGHDPGSIGRGGLQEKDLVLDVALRLEKRVKAELGAEVILTRASDVFIPLEERTAIANSRGADLFLSIHANSARNPPPAASRRTS